MAVGKEFLPILPVPAPYYIVLIMSAAKQAMVLLKPSQTAISGLQGWA